MSALAQMAKWGGDEVSGSDRYFDRGEAARLRAVLVQEGIRIIPQDGAGIRGAKLAVASVAVESDVPDIKEARRQGVKLLTRGEYLARMARGKNALIVAGTNGKSTTTALLSWILEKNGFDPSLVLGAPLRGERRGWGNARLGRSQWFCLEADESDGGIARYKPHVGIITNISPDHFKLTRLERLFADFVRNCEHGLVRNADCPISRRLPRGTARAVAFSIDSPSDFPARDLLLGKDRSSFNLRKERFEVPIPGVHNIYNTLASIAAASFLEIPLARISASLRDFPGLKRRMEIVFSGRGLAVIDDYAHNPAKVSAAIAAARLRGKRVIAIYQPHGFAPLKLFRRELADAFSRSLRAEDLLFILPVYYAGGTAPGDVGPDDLRRAIESESEVKVCRKREELISLLAESAGPGDAILVMGARDPTLSELADDIGVALGVAGRPRNSSGSGKDRSGRK